MNIGVVTAAKRPDLWAATEDEFQALWPEYNLHGDVAGEYFLVLLDRFPHLQFLLVDRETDRVLARGRTIPFPWDGTLDDLPSGIDEMGLRAIAPKSQATTLSALAAEVLPEHQGRGLSAQVVQAMAGIARREGLASLVAPVRPSWKERYPLIGMDRYVRWQREDGLPFDPWMRVHARLGGTILRTAPESMRITGPVSDWESWTGMGFPDEGQYVFPGGLAPLTVTDEGRGLYWEPNVWVLHQV